MRPRHLLGSAAVLIGLGLLALDLQLARVERSWQAMVAATERAQTELEALPTERPVLWGEARPGNAAEDYSRAFALAASTPGVERLQSEWRNARARFEVADDLEARDRFAEALAPAIQAMREGAHRAQYDNLPAWSGALDDRSWQFLTDRLVADAAAAEAERLVLDDQHLEAARLLLDAAQFGRDRAHDVFLNQEVIGLGMLAALTRGALYYRGLAGRLDGDALEQLADGLARLDHDLGPGLGMRGDAILCGLHVIRSPEAWTQGLDDRPLSTWREGFSTRLAISKLILAKLDYAGQHQHFAVLPAAQQGPLEAAARARFVSRAGPLGKDSSPTLAIHDVRRECVASLRLCRMMLTLQLGEDAEPLPDPFGGTLHAERRPDGSLRVWSDHLLRGHRTLELVFDPNAPAPSPR